MAVCVWPHTRNADTHSILFYLCGLPVRNLEICDAVFSDICLYYLILLLPVIQLKPALLFAPVASLTLPLLLSLHLFLVQNCAIPQSICNDSEALSSWLHSTCQTVMDTVAPLKIRQPKTKFEPWLNDTVRAVRRECRRAERNGKRTNCVCPFKY